MLKQLLLCSALCFASIFGDEAEIQWHGRGVRETADFYELRGKCVFNVTENFAPNQFRVNTTFDKEITEFEAWVHWDTVDDDETGRWYLSEFTKEIDEIRDVKLDFNIKWRKSLGAERPNGVCVSQETPRAPAAVFDEGKGTIPIEWDGVREKKKDFEAKGVCRYMLSQNYEANMFQVNVTFTDKEVYKFESDEDWIIVDEEEYNWYLIAYTQNISAGDELKLKFKANYEKYTGIELPNGECTANVVVNSETVLLNADSQLEPSTKSPTDPPIEPPTNPPTEPPTNPPTEPPTNPPTEPPTNPPTEPPTNPPTEPPTNPPTQQPTSPPTEKPTSPPTEPPTNPPTKAPTYPPLPGIFLNDSPETFLQGEVSLEDGDSNGLRLDEEGVTVPFNWVSFRGRKKTFEATGVCRYTFTESYDANVFQVNVTFTDKEIARFESDEDWIIVDEEMGTWYVVEYTKQISSGDVLSLKFKTNYEKSTGVFFPNGECTASLVVYSTTESSITDSPDDSTDSPYSGEDLNQSLLLNQDSVPFLQRVARSADLLGDGNRPGYPTNKNFGCRFYYIDGVLPKCPYCSFHKLQLRHFGRTPSICTSTFSDHGDIDFAAISKRDAPAEDCGVEVGYQNIWTTFDTMNLASRGECPLNFTDFIDTGDFYINVTFDLPTSKFFDYNTMELVESDPAGFWYYSRSIWPFNPNQQWGYSFQVEWIEGDRPSSVCRASVYCDDVAP